MGRDSSLPGMYGHIKVARHRPGGRTDAGRTTRSRVGGLTDKKREPASSGARRNPVERRGDAPQFTVDSMPPRRGDATSSLWLGDVFACPAEKNCTERGVNQTERSRGVRRTCQINAECGRKDECFPSAFYILAQRPTQVGHGAAAAKPAVTGAGAAGTATAGPAGTAGPQPQGGG